MFKKLSNKMENFSEKLKTIKETNEDFGTKKNETCRANINQNKAVVAISISDNADLKATMLLKMKRCISQR